MNILTAGDDASHLEVIARRDRGWAHDVTCAESGRAALKNDAAGDDVVDFFRKQEP